MKTDQALFQASDCDALVGSVIGPELFQIVEASDFRPEDVDDDVAGIDQHPIGIGQAFNLQIPAPVMLEPFDQLVGNGADMTVGPAGSDDHFIGDDGLAIEIDGDDVLGLGIFKLTENGGEERVLCLALGRRLPLGGALRRAVLLSWRCQCGYPL